MSIIQTHLWISILASLRLSGLDSNLSSPFHFPFHFHSQDYDVCMYVHTYIHMYIFYFHLAQLSPVTHFPLPNDILIPSRKIKIWLLKEQSEGPTMRIANVNLTPSALSEWVCVCVCVFFRRREGRSRLPIFSSGVDVVCYGIAQPKEEQDGDGTERTQKRKVGVVV
jgi:hypothetical protein